MNIYLPENRKFLSEKNDFYPIKYQDSIFNQFNLKIIVE